MEYKPEALADSESWALGSTVRNFVFVFLMLMSACGLGGHFLGPQVRWDWYYTIPAVSMLATFKN